MSETARAQWREKTITTMGASLSLVPLLDYFARREFAAAGLSPGAVTLPYPGDGGEATCTVHYWASTGSRAAAAAARAWVRPTGHLAVALPGGPTVPAFPPHRARPHRLRRQLVRRRLRRLAAVGGYAGGGAGGAAGRAAGDEGRRVAVAGTSYGGFVAYWLARTAGAGRVGPVVIASSDLLKTAADDRGFLKRAGDGWSGVEEVLLPAEPAAMRKLLEMASCRPPPPVLMPDFILRDFIQVKTETTPTTSRADNSKTRPSRIART